MPLTTIRSQCYANKNTGLGVGKLLIASWNWALSEELKGSRVPRQSEERDLSRLVEVIGAPRGTKERNRINQTWSIDGIIGILER